jgi:predicted ATPase
VQCPIYTGLSLWLQGYPEQARRQGQVALARAQELNHPFSLAFVQILAAILHHYRREADAAYQCADAALTLATDQRFVLWRAAGLLLRGWALAERGQEAEGLAQMHQGLTIYHATGIEAFLPYALSLPVEAYGRLGQPEAGLGLLDEAIALADKNGEQFHAAELYRLKGDLLLTQATPDAAQADACYHQALALARDMHARSWVLRTVLSLYRLWQQDKRYEARALLHEVYGEFTEGFDTADLQAAQARLAALA